MGAGHYDATEGSIYFFEPHDSCVPQEFAVSSKG